MVLKIAINADVIGDQEAGGVTNVLLGLLAALGKLPDGDETYRVIAPDGARDMLTAYLGPNQEIVTLPQAIPRPSWQRAIGRPLKRAWQFAQNNWGCSTWPTVPLSDGFYESLGCDVIHFPYQRYVLCAIPTIFNPHDLQHLHLPQFFSPAQIAARDTLYSTGCHFAQTVVAASNWVKDDLIRQYGLERQKVQLIPFAPPTMVHSAPDSRLLADVKRKFGLDAPFAFFPANTWAHKNHLRLIEALALLRDRDNLKVQIICTGSQIGNWIQIQKQLKNHNLEHQMRFLGYVTGDEMRCLYRLAEFLVMPTLFESTSEPIYEAWAERIPVTCSSLAPLKEQVKDAALLFDPFSVERIAESLKKMFTDAVLQEELRNRGIKRLEDFSWDRTARAYRALYRKTARHPLTDEDRKLLNWDWMNCPEDELEYSK